MKPHGLPDFQPGLPSEQTSANPDVVPDECHGVPDGGIAEGGEPDCLCSDGHK